MCARVTLSVSRVGVARVGPGPGIPARRSRSQNEAAPPAERAAAGVGFRVVARSTVPVRGTRTMQWRGRADSDSRGSRASTGQHASRVFNPQKNRVVGRFGDVY